MSVPIELLIILLLIMLNGVLAMSEMALISARRARLAAMESKNIRGAAQARRLAEEPNLFLPTLQAFLTLISILIGVFGGDRIGQQIAPFVGRIPLLRPIAYDLSLAVAVMAEAFATLVLGELVPKQLALRHPERVALWFAGAIGVLSRVAAPLVWLLGASSNAVLRVLGVTGMLREAVTEEDLKAVLAEGAEVGVLEEEERGMIERLLRLADKPVRAIMTARTELVWIDRTAPRRDIVTALRSTPHSRFVVCDGAVDNVVGVVQTKDLLDRMLGGGELSLGAALRQPMIVPDTVTAFDVLERLRGDPLGIALVMDEYGSFEGVVTAADVLGAIIGETADTAPATTADTEREYRFDGLLPLDDLKSRLALPALPPGNYHTLAGLILALLQRVPHSGDTIVFAGWRFEVLSMDGRRVETVHVMHEPTIERGGDDEAR